MDKPLVSIVIPAYNEQKNIKKCLESIKAQDYTGPREVIVCNNNSSDNTAQIALDEGVLVVFESGLELSLLVRLVPESLREKL